MKPAFIQHCLSIKNLSREQILQLLDQAQHLISPTGELIPPPALLTGKTVANLFLENSTRTRCSFEMAAQRLGAHVLNFDVNTSSTRKGETMFDTIDYLTAMGTDLFVIRHAEDEAPHQIAAHLGKRASVINAGDGCNEHPTQAMLDAFTIRHYKGDFSRLKVAIVGDVSHSRVARSNLYALTALGVPDIRLVGPAALLSVESQPAHVSLHHDLISGIEDADVVMALRLQRERMQQASIPNAEEYFQEFGLTAEKLKHAKSDAIIMHPGPMNRGVEIASDIADGPQSVIFAQAKFGVAVRMAIMVMLLGR